MLQLCTTQALRTSDANCIYAYPGNRFNLTCVNTIQAAMQWQLGFIGYECHGRFGLRVEDCLKGCIKLRPKSTIPKSLLFLFLCPRNEVTTQELKVLFWSPEFILITCYNHETVLYLVLFSFVSEFFCMGGWEEEVPYSSLLSIHVSI